MFKIGEFSRFCQVPVSALRYYAERGLLEPAAVDSQSGYRYYTAEQLPRINRILALKDLGLSLEEIGGVLDEQLSAAELRGMLRLKQAEIGRRVAEERHRLDRVANRLRLIEQEGTMPTQEIILKTVESIRGLGARDTVVGSAGISEFIGDVFAGVLGSGLQPVAAPVTVYHDPEFDPEAVDVELVVPVPDPQRTLETPAGRILSDRSVCGGEVAVVVHVGPYDTIGESYQALANWVEEHGLGVAGPPREIYLTGPDEPGPPVTEIRMPLERRGAPA